VGFFGTKSLIEILEVRVNYQC